MTFILPTVAVVTAVVATLFRRNRTSFGVAALAVSLVTNWALVPSSSAGAATTFKISNATLSAKVGTSVKVTTTGGGIGVVTFKVAGAHCTIGRTTGALSASAATTCVVTATKVASSGHHANATARFTFSSSSGGLAITNRILTGRVGVPIIVTARGGAGSGTISYATTGSTCSINAATGKLTAFAVGACPVTATKAKSGQYPASTTAPVIFRFRPGPQAPLIIGNGLAGNVGTPVNLFTTGGSGTGRVTFAVTGSGCSLNGATLNATVIGTCVVTATKAASTSFLKATSAPVTFTFAAALPVYSPGDNATPANPDIATLTNISGQTAQVDATSLGDTLFINQYYYKTDRWFLNYINAGATVTMTWHVVGKDGQPLANTAVSLLANLNFSDTYCGVTWGGSVQTLNSCSHTNGSGQGVLASGTDANGDVTFTLTNNNTAPNLPPPSDTTSAAAGNTYEYNEDKGRAGGYPYCDMVLQVGSDVVSANPNATVNQGTDRVDFILIP